MDPETERFLSSGAEKDRIKAINDSSEKFRNRKRDPRNYTDAKEQYGLSHKQWMFCIKYVGEAECVGWKAAAWSYGDANGVKEDGGSMTTIVAKSIASQNLAKPNISACIQDLLGIITISPNEVLHRISRLARANFDDLMDIDENGKAVLNLKKAKQAGVMLLVKKLNMDSFGNLKSIELHDSFAALSKMGQHYKLFDRNRETVVEPRDLARELLDELRAKHEDIPDAMLIAKVLERFSGSGVTESDLIDSPAADQLRG
jgi:hypothetical protein